MKANLHFTPRDFGIKKLWFLFFHFFICFSSNCQESSSNDDKLNLIDSGMGIENSISIYTSKVFYANIKATTGEKTTIKASKLIINGDTLIPEEVSTRGRSSLYLRRKSYNIKLESSASFRHGKTTKSFKKFIVLSLSMDRDYINNRLAFEMMNHLNLFDLFYSFCELRINDQSEGICMVVERPEDWAIKKKDSPMIIRRGYNHNIDKKKTSKIIKTDEAKKYSSFYRNIYRSLNKYKGAELYDNLSSLLDLDLYMKWLAFNFFVRNGDYTDEVFFYIDPDIDKFRIIPWDYDDLFFLKPHEGKTESRNLNGDMYIFSIEDILDKKIAEDPYLYNIYLIQLRDMLQLLTSKVLKRVFENTYSELYPYYSKKEVIDMSVYDTHKEVNLAKLKSNMESLYDNLKIYRVLYINALNAKIY